MQNDDYFSGLPPAPKDTRKTEKSLDDLIDVDDDWIGYGNDDSYYSGSMSLLGDDDDAGEDLDNYIEFGDD